MSKVQNAIELRYMHPMQSPIELCYICSNAQKDKQLIQEMEKRLSRLEQQQQITVWGSQKVRLGVNRKQEIDTHLATAQILLLLVSPDFMASDECYGDAMLKTIKDLIARDTCVIPILLRPTDLPDDSFFGLRFLPTNEKAITKWSNQDEAWVDIVQGIGSAIEYCKKHPVTRQMVKPASPTDCLTTVFLSYAYEDIETVKELQLRLAVRGLRCLPAANDRLASRVRQAIECDADVIVFLFTPASLKEDAIWKVELPAALSRYKNNSHFDIICILQDISPAEVLQCCRDHNLAVDMPPSDLSLTGWNDIAGHILKLALAQRQERLNVNHDNYEPSIVLDTFNEYPSTKGANLILNWFELVRAKKRLHTSEEWEHILLPALDDVRQYIGERASSGRIHISLQCILPAAIALGFVFREPTRITLLLEGKNGIWRTDTQPSEGEPLLVKQVEARQGEQKIAVVEVATTQSTEQGTADALVASGLTPDYHIRLGLPVLSRESVRDAAHALAIAKQVGAACLRLRKEYGVRHIHLFVACPADLAVLIGRQFNALCPITLYEYAQNAYSPVGTLVS